MPDDALDRLGERAQQLGRAVEAVLELETTARSSDGAVSAAARGGRLVEVMLPATPVAAGHAAAAHAGLVDAIHEAVAAALHESYRVMQEASERMTADLLPRPGDGAAR